MEKECARSAQMEGMNGLCEAAYHDEPTDEYHGIASPKADHP
jgi:hypothetical protein